MAKMLKKIFLAALIISIGLWAAIAIKNVMDNTIVVERYDSDGLYLWSDRYTRITECSGFGRGGAVLQEFYNEGNLFYKYSGHNEYGDVYVRVDAKKFKLLRNLNGIWYVYYHKSHKIKLYPNY